MKLQYTYLLALFLYCQFNSAQTATVTGDTLKSAEQPTVAAPDSEPLLKIKALPDDSTSNADPAVTNTVSETPPSPALEAPVQVSSSPGPDKKSAAAQARNLKTANQLYEKKAYAEAIPYFEKARQSDSSNTLVISRLGDCYRLTSNSTGKLHCYGALIRAGAAEPIHNLYYGQALLEMGEAEKAKEFFDKYDADSRGKSLSSSFHKMKTYTRNSDAYSVYPSSFNSPQNDLCAVKFHESVVFTSSRRKTAWIRREQGWTDAPYMSLYVAGKDAAGADLPPQIFMNDLNSKFHDGPASFTKDFNTVFFTRNNFTKEERAADGTFKLKIMEANLDQNGFSMVKLMPFGNKEFNFAHPSISPDGYTLYFCSDIEGGKGGMDIWVTRKDSSGTWGTPVNLGEKVNTAGSEVFPFIAANGAFYFSSDGHDGMGGLDIYEAKMKDGMPLKIYNMGEPVNSSKDDFGMYLSDDNKTGFISSNRKAGGLDDDIYNLLVLREVKRGKEVKLALKDRDTGDSIPGAKIVINGDTVLANEKGEYLLSAEEGQMYRLDAVHKDFFSGKDSVSAASSDEDSFTRGQLYARDQAGEGPQAVPSRHSNRCEDRRAARGRDHQAHRSHHQYRRRRVHHNNRGRLFQVPFRQQGRRQAGLPGAYRQAGLSPEDNGIHAHDR
jgi:tetratricopeptide (TPR) repeat protein